MNKDTALRLALTVLDDYVEDPRCKHEIDQAITAIKAALEAKDEPVAWMYPDDLKRFETSESYAEAYSIEMVSPTQGETVPLYTTPPQRKPLTDEEIDTIGATIFKAEFLDDTEVKSNRELARAIEAKLKEKNT